MNAILTARKVSKCFAAEETEVQAVRDIDLDIIEGDFTVIMGSSGSGKSTLLYSLSGLDRPSSGEVSYKNKRLDSMSERDLAILRRKSFGFVFQNINLVPNLSIEENILVAACLPKGGRVDAERRTDELLDILGIASIASHLPGESSGGEQQRAAAARALVNKPDILFADEPTGALNFAAGQQLLDLLNIVNRRGQSIVMVTHDLKAAARGNRVLFMRDGSIVGDYRFATDLQPSAEGADEWAARLAGLQAQREKALFAWLSERGW